MTKKSTLDLAKELIACPSVTPATGAVFDVMAAMLEPLGFEVTRFIAGDVPEDEDSGGAVENLFAIRKGRPGTRHFAFAGHLDVVPPGEGWASDPFVPEVRGDLLHGRGAVDMKGSIAAFVSALQNVPDDLGTISLIITGETQHGSPRRFALRNDESAARFSGRPRTL